MNENLKKRNEILADIVIKGLKSRNMTLILSHVNEQPMKVMEKAGFIEKAGRENFCENIDKALERARTLDK